jgi:hypothetical protein
MNSSFVTWTEGDAADCETLSSCVQLFIAKDGLFAVSEIAPASQTDASAAVVRLA